MANSLTTLTPYHVLAYGTLLGTAVYQSFVGGIIAYRALPRPQFSSLQAAIFPVYFAIQSALPVVLALTYPASPTTPSSLPGVLAEENRGNVLAPLAVMAVTGLANSLVFGPNTKNLMRLRKHQETRDGKKSYDKGPHSPEMQRLNNAFGKAHGLSSLSNLIALIATIWYGVSLSDRIV